MDDSIMARELTQEEIMKFPLEVRKQMADQVRAQNTPEKLQKRIAEERQRINIGEDPIKTALFPRGMAQAAGSQGDPLGAGVGDFFSTLGRAIASSPEGKGFLESMAQTKGEGFWGDLLRSPELGAAVFAAPFVAPAIAGMTTAGASPLAAGAIGGLVEGGFVGLSSQASKMGEGKKFDPVQFAIDLGVSAMTPIVGSAFKTASKPIKNWMMSIAEKKINPALSKISSELSGVSQEALEIASTKKGRSRLIESAGKAKELGDGILNALDNIDETYQFNNKLHLALSDMPEISTKNVINSLETSLKKLRTGLQTTPKTAAGDRIEKELLSAKSLGEKMSAVDFRDMRKDIDFMVKFDVEGADLINGAMKKAREQAKNDLLDASKFNPDYAEIMKDYSNVLDVRDNLYKNYLGTRADIREKRIESFVNNLFGRNKTHAQNAIKDMENVFGESFIDEIKLTSLAKEMVKDGAIPFFPVQTTGRAAIGGLGTAGQIGAGVLTGNIPLMGTGLATGALSSPKIAPRVLEGVRGLSSGNIISDLATNPILQRTVPALLRPGVQQGLGDFQ
jgi:hypothetical protein